MMACPGECTFVEEQEPSGRLIVGPCLGCGTPAMTALAEAIRDRDYQAMIAGDHKARADAAERLLDMFQATP